MTVTGRVYYLSYKQNCAIRNELSCWRLQSVVQPKPKLIKTSPVSATAIGIDSNKEATQTLVAVTKPLHRLIWVRLRCDCACFIWFARIRNHIRFLRKLPTHLADQSTKQLAGYFDFIFVCGNIVSTNMLHKCVLESIRCIEANKMFLRYIAGKTNQNIQIDYIIRQSVFDKHTASQLKIISSWNGKKECIIVKYVQDIALRLHNLREKEPRCTLARRRTRASLSSPTTT